MCFGVPKPADVVIYDECNSQFVRHAINSKYQVGIFNQRPANVFLGLKIILGVIKGLTKLQLSEVVKHPRGILVGFLSQLLFLHDKSCLLFMHPKAVVTFIDNSASFSRLANSCRAIPFIAIQNGSRLSYAASQDRIYHQHYFCFGDHETHLLPRLGWQVEHYYPVGSLIASLHFKLPQIVQKSERDMLLVSTWRGNIGYTKDVQDTMRSMRIMDEYLADFIRTRNITATVILRAERDSEHWFMPELGLAEDEYFRDIYGDSIEIIDTDFSVRNIFPLMQTSDLIVSCLSSALMEALGIGKKICYFNFTGTDLYHQDIDEQLICKDANRESFFERLDDLLAILPSEYARKAGGLRVFYMSNDEAIPTYQRIRDGIDQIIEGQPT